jgi:hypothetical protein|tara:strand:+ start:59 stop:649 length:591 start_codon:yes stop_codon:yes gene_type:complete
MTTKNIWETRYKNGGNSGSGSYNELCEFKNNILNTFISENNINSIIDFGCGDCNQIKNVPIENYIGLDISEYIIQTHNDTYKDDSSKSFLVYDDKTNYTIKSDVTLSLDVLYHILEDNLFITYLQHLFTCSTKHVIIYSSNFEGHSQGHMKTRKFTDHVEKLFPNWKLTSFIKQKYPKKSSADFYIYTLQDNADTK